MKILITNDDGIHSEGIYKLKLALEKIGDVIVVAPDTEKSAVGHAITISDPLRVTEVEKDGKFFGFAVNGTPADCVKIGITSLMDEPPDIVVSGINLGPNTATNIIYSGTVSAAAEGVIMGIPSMALSLNSFTDKEYDYSCKLAIELVNKILKNGLMEGTLLNVNVPALKEEEIEGIVITRQGKGRYVEFFDKRVDPFNRTYYWLSGKKMMFDSDNDIDDVVVTQNKVSITPISYELTNMDMLQKLKSWDIER
jgi:5'/3'-nucleotidase